MSPIGHSEERLEDLHHLFVIKNLPSRVQVSTQSMGRPKQIPPGLNAIQRWETLFMITSPWRPIPAWYAEYWWGIHRLFIAIGNLLFEYIPRKVGLGVLTKDHLAGDCSRTQNWQFTIPQTRLAKALTGRR